MEPISDWRLSVSDAARLELRDDLGRAPSVAPPDLAAGILITRVYLDRSPVIRHGRSNSMVCV